MQGFKPVMRHVLLVVVAALLLGIAGTAARVGAQGPMREVVVKAVDYGFKAPDQVEAGLTTFVMENAGQELHHAQIARLRDGKTIDDLQAAIRQGEAAMFGVLQFVGGNGVVVPGMRTDRVTLDLKEGSYVYICFVASPDGTPHFAKGMIKPFTVVAATSSPPAPPTSNGNIVMRDFAFEMTGTLQAGANTWRIENVGPQPHEFGLMRLAPGKTINDLFAFLGGNASGPPPAMPVGGMQALEVGLDGWLTSDLQSGSYVGVCLIPDPQSGKTHAELGMVTQFEIGNAEAPVPAALPDTGRTSALPYLLVLVVLLLGGGWMLRRRSA